MYLINQEEDNIKSLVKSLRPIKYIYSKQNKVYDKYFHGSSLKALINQMNSPKKFNEILQPGESLEEKNKEKSIMDINFKSTFNYIDELSSLKKLPILLNNKQNEYNSGYKKILKKNLKIIKRNEKTKNIKLIKSKKENDDEVTLDPGRYHPNYDYIRRRYPCTYFGYIKKEENNNIEKNLKKNKIEENDEKKKENDEKNKKIKKNIIDNNNQEETNNNLAKINKKDVKKEVISESSPKNILEFKKINNFVKQKKLNFNLSNEYSKLKKSSNRYLRKTIHIRDKYSNTNFKEQNKASSLTNKIDFEISKKMNEQLKYKEGNIHRNNNHKHNFNNIKSESLVLRKNGKELMKNSSLENFRCLTIFDKMIGRDKSLIFKGLEGSRTSYNPKYNIVRPHIPSFKFKSERKYKEFKKYIIGKIIRSYCFNPEKYFALEYKENEENEISGKYISMILKS